MDLNHIYIDGSKFEANANKYSRVWKKATEKSRYRLFEKITSLPEEINGGLAFSGIRIQTNTEYVPEQLEEILERCGHIWKLNEEAFAKGRGHRKTIQSEGTFGIMKYDRWYKRLVRKGMKSVRMAIFLVSIGYNLCKYYNKQMRKLSQAA